MSDWLEHSDQIEINLPVDLVWSLWSDLEKMPQWMGWIKSVHILDKDPTLSRWTLASGTVEFSWLAKMLQVVPHQIMQWESVDGLPNRGAVYFYNRLGKGTVVKMSIAFQIPGILGPLLDNLFLGKLVESHIREDLIRFRDFALNEHHKTEQTRC
jgi:uncharacterized membrane protein